jgi:hypothetical protein
MQIFYFFSDYTPAKFGLEAAQGIARVFRTSVERSLLTAALCLTMPLLEAVICYCSNRVELAVRFGPILQRIWGFASADEMKTILSA